MRSGPTRPLRLSPSASHAITAALSREPSCLCRQTWLRGPASFADGAGLRRRSSRSISARVRRLDSGETRTRGQISPRRTRSVLRLPRLRKSGVMSSLSPTRRRPVAGIGRTAASPRSRAAMARAIAAPEIVLTAERTAEMTAARAIEAPEIVLTAMARAIAARLATRATRMTEMAGSLLRTGAGATVVLRRRPLGRRGPPPERATHRVLPLMFPGRRVRTPRPRPTRTAARRMLR